MILRRCRVRIVREISKCFCRIQNYLEFCIIHLQLINAVNIQWLLGRKSIEESLQWQFCELPFM